MFRRILSPKACDCFAGFFVGVKKTMVLVFIRLSFMPLWPRLNVVVRDKGLGLPIAMVPVKVGVLDVDVFVMTI